MSQELELGLAELIHDEQLKTKALKRRERKQAERDELNGEVVKLKRVSNQRYFDEANDYTDVRYLQRVRRYSDLVE